MSDSYQRTIKVSCYKYLHCKRKPKVSYDILLREKTKVSYLIIWLVPQAGKMQRILCTDWLPERARWAYLARSGLPALVPQKRKSVGVMFWPYNKSFIDQACSAVKMAGYWPRSFFAFLWTSTSSRFIKTQKRTWPISSDLDLTLGQ